MMRPLWSFGITNLELPAVLGAAGGQSQSCPSTAGAHHEVQWGSSVMTATGEKRVRTIIQANNICGFGRG